MMSLENRLCEFFVQPLFCRLKGAGEPSPQEAAKLSGSIGSPKGLAAGNSWDSPFFLVSKITF